MLILVDLLIIQMMKLVTLLIRGLPLIYFLRES